MVSHADPMESFVQSVRDAISPLESGFIRFSKDLESHWSKDSRFELRDFDFFARSSGSMERMAIDASDEKKKGVS
ncbi:uncharacterized protein A4U43_C05F29840 [Asparagus officinalis]|uniref:Uncharacterized protein n=1 Tax=Asparagus officinalis TaxID=4686 RepID=A0A5P1F001_ASPOF|nr:uncharacterized protein A4U43_C05F29840 [Asparagus officinalis]